MKKFFAEFKKFITRGNVMDMAVGVIVGGAFTAIVNGLSNFILKPLINYALAMLLGKDTLSEIHTMLLPAYTVDEAGVQTLDLANSIYLDWGSFINAIINFFLIAFVLFCIVRAFNRVRENQKEAAEKAKGRKAKKADRKLMKAEVSRSVTRPPSPPGTPPVPRKPPPRLPPLPPPPRRRQDWTASPTPPPRICSRTSSQS